MLGCWLAIKMIVAFTVRISRWLIRRTITDSRDARKKHEYLLSRFFILTESETRYNSGESVFRCVEMILKSKFAGVRSVLIISPFRHTFAVLRDRKGSDSVVDSLKSRSISVGATQLALTVKRELVCRSRSSRVCIHTSIEFEASCTLLLAHVYRHDTYIYT